MSDEPRPPALDPPGPIALVVTDLDGTLWDQDGQLHALTRAALTELEQRGIPVLAATGRRPHSVWQRMQANGIALPAVVFDGALGQEYASRATFHRHGFAPADAARVLAILDGLGIEPCVNIDDATRDVVVGARPTTHPAHLAFITPWLRREDLATAVQTHAVLSFIVCGREPARLEPAIDAVVGLATATVSRDLNYGGVTLSVRPPGVSKWNGVLAYCRAYQLDPRRVLAIGDGENDLELLRAAAVACAVADGCAAVRELAHHELPPAHQGGWAGILDLLPGAPAGRQREARQWAQRWRETEGESWYSSPHDDRPDL
jgi:hydroxymethylpyrimidine pyrophosphatase-like HAD family hydrolase